MNYNIDKLFSTSDTHFNHVNCIKYDNRPFKTIEQMNETLIENWNSIVPKDGVVFHIGDVALGRPEDLDSILRALNGKIILIKGNHEAAATHKINKYRFEFIDKYYELELGDKQLICMIHYPMACWNQSHYGKSWNLHGHSHGKFSGQGKQYDVGSPCNNYTPKSFHEIKKIIDKKKAFDQVTQQILEGSPSPRKTRLLNRMYNTRGIEV